MAEQILPQPVFLLTDEYGCTLDAGNHGTAPYNLLLTCTAEDGMNSESVSLTFTQVLRLASKCLDWLGEQAARTPVQEVDRG
jgi:hypothetical protein